MDKIPNINKIDPIEIYPQPCIPCGAAVPPAPPFRYVNYDTMIINKPTLNGVLIEGNKTSADYHIEGADLSDYYTKEEVNALIPDYLKNYYTKSQIDNKLPDMTNYYTKAQVDGMIPDLNDYYTKSQVDALLPDLSNYYTKSQTYSKSEVDSLLPDMSDYYTKTQVDALLPDMSDYYTTEEIDDTVDALEGLISNKQDTLVSGTNIKTVNNQSLLGSGNLDITGALVVRYGDATHAELVSAVVTSKPIVMTFDDGDTLVMTALSGWNASDNVELRCCGGVWDIQITVTPQNVWSFQETQLATNAQVNAKQDTLVSGTNIKTVNGQSLLGSGNIDIDNGIYIAGFFVTSHAKLLNAINNRMAIMLTDTGYDTVMVTCSLVQSGSNDIILYVNFDSYQMAYTITTDNVWSSERKNGMYEYAIDMTSQYIHYQDAARAVNSGMTLILEDPTSGRRFIPTNFGVNNSAVYAQYLDDNLQLVTFEIWSDDTVHIEPVGLATSEDVEYAMGQYKVKQFVQTINITVPPCTNDISNTTIPKVVFTLTGDEAAEYMFRGVIAYEVFDAETGGNRINYLPVCQFTGQNSTELSIRGCVMGGNSKTARRFACWALLQHR